jgi:hypothetical protein
LLRSADREEEREHGSWKNSAAAKVQQNTSDPRLDVFKLNFAGEKN